jgi:hypothetical protein
MSQEWAPFAKSAKEQETLLMLSGKTPEGKAKYKALIEDRKRSLFEVITADFTSIKVPLDHFLHLAPRLQPRYYTISSSSNAHPNRIHLTVSVIEEVSFFSLSLSLSLFFVSLFRLCTAKHLLKILFDDALSFYLFIFSLLCSDFNFKIIKERENNSLFRGVCSGFMQDLEPPTTSASSGKR